MHHGHGNWQPGWARFGHQHDAQSPDNIVLEVGPGGSYLLNQRPVAAAALEATLAQVFAPRPRKVLFVKGGEQVAYAEVVRAVDASRAAGVDVIGLVPRARVE